MKMICLCKSIGTLFIDLAPIAVRHIFRERQNNVRMDCHHRTELSMKSF